MKNGSAIKWLGDGLRRVCDVLCGRRDTDKYKWFSSLIEFLIR